MSFRKIAAIAASAAAVTAYARYRRDMAGIRDAVDAGSTIVETRAGDIEYAESGEGEPVLVIHGAGGGYDQGLLIARDLARDHRIVAPSRFGYLKTPVPADPSPAGQAEAHAALLDFLAIDRAVVVGASAGAPSAIELALNHPDRVSALVLLVPRTYDPTQSMGVDESAQSQLVLRLIESSADFLFWLASRAARSAVVRFLGVPPELESDASAADRARVTEIIRSVLPLSARARGIAVDSATRLQPWPLEKIRVPTLVISARDDLFETLPGARFTANGIPGAELKVLDSGGHLMVGQGAKVAKQVRRFLRRNLDGGLLGLVKHSGTVAKTERKPPLRHKDRHVAKVLEPLV